MYSVNIEKKYSGTGENICEISHVFCCCCCSQLNAVKKMTLCYRINSYKLSVTDIHY